MCSVTVFGVEGETLAPCHPARARQLLKKKRAVVKSIQPYSIRLLSRSGVIPSSKPSLPANSFPLSNADLPANVSGHPHSITPFNPDSLAKPFHGKAGNRQTQTVEMPR
jgi:hypothetical protein